MRDDLILDNLNLIYFVLKQLGLYEQRDNYYDLGLIGLVRAANEYDETKGYTFTTYAATCIRNEILRDIRHNQSDKRKANLNTISLEVVVNSDAGKDTLLIDSIPSDFDMEEYIIQREDMLALHKAFKMLDAKEQLLIKRYYGPSKVTQVEIAKEFKTTQTAISRKLKSIIHKIRDLMGLDDEGRPKWM